MTILEAPAEASAQSNSRDHDLERVDHYLNDEAYHHPVSRLCSTPSTDMCIAEAISGETVLSKGFAVVLRTIGHASGIKLISSASSV